MDKHHWNYRIVAFEENDGSKYFAIHEVHYRNDVPCAYGREGTVFWTEEDGDDTPNLVLQRLGAALSKPALNVKDFGPGGS